MKFSDIRGKKREYAESPESDGNFRNAALMEISPEYSG